MIGPWVMVIVLAGERAALSIPGFESWKACDVASKRVARDMMYTVSTTCVRLTEDKRVKP